MNLDEQLQYIATLQRSHDEQITRLVEQGDRNERHINALAGHMNILTERTIQAMDAINRLARIADSHEDRIGGLEHPTQ
ncbi:MAG TPA: hypothetical protein VHY84_01165 [Bryobacteraceae bacterium]|nr:hypothetical protein [Bryobacteraceae bacterium]